MEYGKIIAISGMPGLYELVGSKKDGAIVRSLDDKSTKFVSSRIHNFSHLESIEVYTTGENVNLVEVLAQINQSGEELPSEKDAAAIKGFFQKVYPEMDFERVYASDMKKMVKWYSILKANDVDFKLTEEPEEDQTEDGQAEEGGEDSMAGVTNENQPEQDQPADTIETQGGDVAAPETVIPDSEVETITLPEGEASKKKAPKKKKSED